MMRSMGLVAAAFLTVGVVPAAQAAEAPTASLCVDVTVMQRPPDVSVSAPYSCACGPLVTRHPIPAGYVLTFNTGCLQ